MCTQNTNCNKCNNTPDCACKVLISSDCVSNVTEDLTCSNILKGQTLTEVLVQLDAFICEKFGTVQNFFQVINIGTGEGVYKGINGLGKKEFKSLLGSGLITLVSADTDNEITISINEATMKTFIQANQKTYTLANRSTGIGTGIYKDATTVTDNIQYNLRKINSVKSLDVTLDADDNVKVELKDSIINVGTEGAVSILDTFDTTEKKHKIRKLISNTLSISVNDTTGNLEIDTPSTATIPALYVNQDYIPTYDDWTSAGGVLGDNFYYNGDGSLSRPYTNSVKYTTSTVKETTANTAIQNALDAYVGTGGRGTILDADLPQEVGKTIIIQKSSTLGNYGFTGDFNYHSISIQLEEGAYISHNNSDTSSWLIDMDLFENDETNIARLSIAKDAFILTLNNGFRNKGTLNSTSNYTITKTINLSGEGGIRQITNNSAQVRTLIDSNRLNTSGYNNDGQNTYIIEDIQLISDTQRLLDLGDSFTRFTNVALASSSILVNITVDAQSLNFVGGTHIFDNCSFNIQGSNSVYRDAAIHVIGDDTSIKMVRPLFSAKANALFKLDATNPNMEIIGATTLYFDVPIIIESDHTTPKCITVVLRNNIFETGSIPDNIDLTCNNYLSTFNIVGLNIIESLRSFADDTAAESAPLPLPKGAKYYNTTAGAVSIVQ